jgi:hypothetical protein
MVKGRSNSPIFQDILRCVQLKTEIWIQKKLDGLAEKWGFKKPENWPLLIRKKELKKMRKGES